jgi:hypothetical protein
LLLAFAVKKALLECISFAHWAITHEFYHTQERLVFQSGPNRGLPSLGIGQYFVSIVGNLICNKKTKYMLSFRWKNGFLYVIHLNKCVFRPSKYFKIFFGAKLLRHVFKHDEATLLRTILWNILTVWKRTCLGVLHMEIHFSYRNTFYILW